MFLKIVKLTFYIYDKCIIDKPLVTLMQLYYL